jgi:hypothetical protein
MIEFGGLRSKRGRYDGNEIKSSIIDKLFRFDKEEKKKEEA